MRNKNIIIAFLAGITGGAISGIMITSDRGSSLRKTISQKIYKYLSKFSLGNRHKEHGSINKAGMTTYTNTEIKSHIPDNIKLNDEY